MEYLLARSDRQLGICLRMLYDEGYKGLVVESVINAKNRMEFHVKVMADEATMAKLNERYSQHLYGKAADIQVQGISVEQVYAYADKLLSGRGGVGIYPPGLGRANGWVHVDVRKEKSRWRG